MKRIKSYLRLTAAYIRLNLNAQLEYRSAFYSRVIAMFLNDGAWVAFWILFFHRFPVINGWGVRDVITLWALAATGFGLAFTICGNSMSLAALIARGELDAWMLYPRPLLSHLVLGKMSATACGDVLFGVSVYLVLIRPAAAHIAAFLLFSTASAAALVGFSVLTGSLGFYLGNASGLASQWQAAALSFSTYPEMLFRGGVKALLYTVVPAGFITYLPLRALKSFTLSSAALSLGGAATVLLVGSLVFYHGLRRYESGSLMEMRG